MSLAYPRTCVVVLLLVLTAAVRLSAGHRCPQVERRQSALLLCRGGLSLGSQMAASMLPDSDLVLSFRRHDASAGPDGSGLASGACGWALRPSERHEPRRLVVPWNGPLALVPYPIGHQARPCSADLTCVMEMCAYDEGTELRAVDGYIRLLFGGGMMAGAGVPDDRRPSGPPHHPRPPHHRVAAAPS